jgi:hypothetical protein
MIEFVAYLSAQQGTDDLARQALPDAPVRPDRKVRRAPALAPVRAQLSLALRRLADRIEPAPTRQPATAGC